MATALSQTVRSLQQPPGPKGRFLAGGTLEMGKSWMNFMTSLSRQYGDVVLFHFLNSPICLLTHPKDIEAVLVTNADNFVKSRDYRALRQLLGNGLLTSEGDLWRRQRKLIQPAFRHESILEYSQVMVECAERTLGAWTDGESFDVQARMMALTLEIVALSLFGADVSGDVADVGKAMRVVTDRFVKLANLTFILPEWFPLPRSFRVKRAHRKLDEIIFRIIRQHAAAADRFHDLTSVLLGARDERGNPMSEHQVRDEMLTLFMAGHETTALALSWTWYLLAQNPDVEAKLAAELDAVLAGRAPTAGDLRLLPYTEMVIKESMRLYPPAWGIGRQAVKECELGGYRLAPRTTVLVSQWITQRDARFYEDPESFNPERWASDPIRIGKLPRFAYFPFGGGPRVCVGAGFAMLEATLLLATIARRFKLELVEGSPVELHPTVTLRPKHGIQVVVHAR